MYTDLTHTRLSRLLGRSQLPTADTTPIRSTGHHMERIASWSLGCVTMHPCPASQPPHAHVCVAHPHTAHNERERDESESGANANLAQFVN